MNHDVVYVSVASAVSLAGALSDVRSRRIPNRLTYPALLLGVVMHAALEGFAGVLHSLEGIAIGGGIFLVFYLVRAMGAGDVKLMAAACAIAGAEHAMTMVIACALAGGVFAIIMMIRRRRVVKTLQNLASLLGHHAGHGMQPHPEINLGCTDSVRLPYGLAIATGVLYSLCVVVLGR